MKVYEDGMPEYLMAWIQEQHVFWVASAPLSVDGHVNLSTKGLRGTFHIVNSKKVWYEDMAGSGSETISHVRENGRITILFNAFEGPPRIARLHGKGTVCEFGTPQYNELLPPSDRHPGSRSIIVVEVERVSTSCGYTVPFYEFRGHRDDTYYKIAETLEKSDLTAQDEIPEKAVPEKGLREYLSTVNSKSIDGLPAITVAQEANRGPLNPMLGTFPRIKPTSTPETRDTLGKAGMVMQIVDVRFLVGIFMGLLLSILYSRVGVALVSVKAE